MAEGFVVLVAIVLGAALPILPVQILWINMTTAVALGLMLAFEPKEPGIMARAPRDPSTPLLTRALVERVVLVSTLLVAGSWWLFHWEQANGANLAEARTAALNLFVVVEALYLFNCRSFSRSVFQLGLLSNRWILAGLGMQTLGQVALTYLPAMNGVSSGPLRSVQARGSASFGLPAAASAVVAAEKRWRRRSRSTPLNSRRGWQTPAMHGRPPPFCAASTIRIPPTLHRPPAILAGPTQGLRTRTRCPHYNSGDSGFDCDHRAWDPVEDPLGGVSHDLADDT